MRQRVGIASALFIVAGIAVSCADADVVLYVAAAQKTGANNGTSWNNAFRGSLGVQNALAAAYPIAASGTPVQIWVARGTYRPTAIRTEINKSFELKNNIGLYGGFLGSETQLAQRNPAANESVLSGKLDPGDPFLRTTHVVIATDVGPSATLNGFTIRDGGSPDSPFSSGGGFLCTRSSLTVASCKIYSNSSRRGGAGIAIVGPCSPRIDGCDFQGNRNFGAFLPGGGLWCDGSTPTVTHSSFVGNGGSSTVGGNIYCGGGGKLLVADCVLASGSGDGGAAIACYGGQVRALRCTIRDNRGAQSGALEGSGIIARECVFLRNRTGTGPDYGSILVGSGSFVDCTFAEHSASHAMFIGASGTFVRCRFERNVATHSSDLLIQFNSCAVDECVFVGNRCGRGLFNPTAGAVNCTVVANTVSSGGGHAVYLGGPSSHLENSIVWGNTIGERVNEAAQVGGDRANIQLRYNTIQGWSGTLGGVANNGKDPRFVDPLGPDGVAGTSDDDLRLLAVSPCIDAADWNALPLDAFDLDGDGVLSERLPLDFEGNPRWVDSPLLSNVGAGQFPFVDRGAYEFVSGSGSDSAVWTSPSGGYFSAGANWFPIAPGPRDEAVFDSGSPAVEFSQNAAVRSLLVRGGSPVLKLGNRMFRISDPTGVRLAPSSSQPCSLRVEGGILDTPSILVRPNSTMSGSTTITGGIENSGVLSPGGGGYGTMTVQGRYRQSSTTPAGQVFAGTLSMDVGQTGSGPYQFDQLIAGDSALTGKLIINRLGSFDPPVGQRIIKLIDAAAADQGRFSVASLPAFPANSTGDNSRFFYISYVPTDQGTEVFLNVGTLGGNVNYGEGGNSQNISVEPSAVATGDVTGDGLADLVIAIPGAQLGPGSVLVFKNQGLNGGVWQGWASTPTDQYTVGKNPRGLAIGELDGRPGLEIAVANTGYPAQSPTGSPDRGSVSILVNDPANQGHFTVTNITSNLPPLTDAGSFPVGIAIAELEGGPTSLPEIALALSGNLSQSLVLENEDDLIFEPCPIPTGPFPTAVAIADFTGDGLLDLAFANAGDGTVSVRINDPTAPMSFQSGPTLLTGPAPIQIIASDLNRDGRADLMTRNTGDNSLSFIIARGPAQFDAQVSLPAGSAASPTRSAAVLDMDQDGDADIAFASGNDANIKVYRNDLTSGQLNFALLNEPIATPGITLLLATADVENDGRVDLVPIVRGPADTGADAVVIPNRFRSHCFTANCDRSTTPPVLNANDFQCFLQLFATADPLANCDESTTSPVLNSLDFQCFLNEFVAASVSGCS